MKLSIKIYRYLSKTNTRFYLNFPIPVTHRQFFRIISQNLEYVRNFRNDRNNSFHFSIR